MKIKVKKLCKEAVLPTIGSPFAAGADLYSAEKEEITVKPGETKFIGTGIAPELPEGLCEERSRVQERFGSRE